MTYEKQTGFTVSPTEMLTVKLVAAVRALMAGGLARIPVLQVTLSFVPSVSSSWIKIWLLAVTADVLTVTLVPDAAITNEPAAADPQTAGDAEEEQFVAVVIVAGGAPVIVPVVFRLPEPSTVNAPPAAPKDVPMVKFPLTCAFTKPPPAFDTLNPWFVPAANGKPQCVPPRRFITVTSPLLQTFNATLPRAGSVLAASVVLSVLMFMSPSSEDPVLI